MIKSKLAILIDSIFITLISFVVSYFWIRKYIKSAFFVIFISILISLSVFFVTFKYFMKKYNLSNISIKENKHLLSCLKSLKFSNKNFFITYFENLLSCTYKFNQFFENENNIYYINFRTILSLNEFYNIYDFSLINKNKPIIILCDSYDENFKTLLTNVNFYIFNFNDIYHIMKLKNLFPISIAENKTFKTNLKNKLSIFLSTINKSNFKNYFFSGLSLMLISFFIPFSFYYAVCGTIFLILSIFCLTRTKQLSLSNNQNKNLFELIKK